MANYRGVQQTFSFPMLSSAEILATWDDVPLQAKDLEKPTASSVRAVYETLCEQCIGPLAREEINTLLESAMGNMEFPELHEEAIPQLAFFRCVNRLLVAAGVYDFNMTDILKPDPKRFKRNLCAIINFQKFRLERLEAFDKLHAQLAELCDEKAAVEEECAAIQEKIRQIQEQKRAEEPRIDALKKECRELESELKQSNKEHSSLQNELKQLKAKSNELKDYLATLRFQKLNLVQEKERLEKNIVRSPERLKSELAQQRRQLENDRAENERVEEYLEELHRKANTLEKTESQSSSLLSLIQKVEKSMTECKNAAKENKKMATSIKEHGNNMRQLHVQKAEAERQIEIAQDRLARLEKTKALKLAAADHALREATEERNTLHQRNYDLQSQTSDVVQKIRAVEQAIAQQKHAHEQALEKRRLALKRLDNIVDQSSESLFHRISC